MCKHMDCGTLCTDVDYAERHSTECTGWNAMHHVARLEKQPPRQPPTHSNVRLAQNDLKRNWVCHSIRVMAEELKKPRQTTKSKPGKAEWDTAVVEIFINIYYQGSNIKGLNDAVRVALQVEGYGISLKQISGKKRTKGFQFAAQARHNSKEKVERGDAQKRVGETVQSTPGSNPSRQETLSEDE